MKTNLLFLLLVSSLFAFSQKPLALKEVRTKQGQVVPEAVQPSALAQRTNVVTPGCTFAGTLAASDLSFATRPLMPGIASSCDIQVDYPGDVTSGPYYYDLYSYTNTSSATECVKVYFGGVQNYVASFASLNCFNPNNLAANYLATGGRGAVTMQQYSFNLAPQATAIIAVVSFSANSTSDYDLQIEGSGVCGIYSPAVVIHCTGSKSRNTDLKLCTHAVTTNGWDATTDDICGNTTLTYSLSGATTGSGTTLNGAVFNKGVTTVTWTGQNIFGQSSSCNFDVTVVDNQAPKVTCPTVTFPMKRADNLQCGWTVPGDILKAKATDNCGVSSLSYTLTGATSGTGTTLNGRVFNLGTTTVTWTAMDDAGNSTSCGFDITVVDDRAPKLKCLDNQARFTEANKCTWKCRSDKLNAIATDNCTLASVTYTLSGATTGTGTTLNGVIFNKGVTTITWTAIDNSGNTTSCSFDLQVTDNDAPVVTCPALSTTHMPTNTGQCTWTSANDDLNATATDNCGVLSLMYELTGATTGTGKSLNGAIFNTGTTTITWTAMDGAGNSNMCSFDITVEDNSAPLVRCPGDVVKYRYTDPAMCGWTCVTSNIDATASDNCGIQSVSYTLSGATTGTGTTLNGVTFNKGVTTVLWTATDNSGNTATCSYDIQVIDDDAPVTTCPAITTNMSTDAGQCTWTSTTDDLNATASDNCGVSSLMYELTGATTGTGATLNGVTFNLGVTTVTWTASDEGGNTSSCSFDITVEDKGAPVVHCPGSAIKNRYTAANNCSWTCRTSNLDATATDNCGVVVSVWYTLRGATTGTGTTLNGVTFNKGVTTVTWSATDNANNTGSCSYDVQVVDDDAPVVTCPALTSTDRGTDNGQCTWTSTNDDLNATASDNCGVSSLMYELTGATTGTGTSLSGVTFNKGITTVSWTAMDDAGNSANCSYSITVADGESPLINCPTLADNTRSTDAGACTWTSTNNDLDATASDNCGVSSLMYELTGATTGTGTTLNGVSFNKGTTTVMWTAVDNAGHTVSCSFDIIVNDTEAPTLADCPSDTTINPTSLNGADYSYTAPTGSDNCPGSATGRTAGPASGSTFPIGTTTVTHTVIDASGNVTSCSFTVTVRDPRKDADHVYVCHSGQNRAVPNGDLQTHLNHGDQLGKCEWYTTSSAARPIVGTTNAEVNEQLSAYPNPTRGQVNLKLPTLKTAGAEVIIMQMNGRIVERRSIGKANGQIEKLNFEKYSNGLYIVKVVSEEGVKVVKIAVQR